VRPAGLPRQDELRPGRLEAIEGRRVAIERLLLRYGPTEEDALRGRAEAAAEFAALEDVDRGLAEADAALVDARAAYAAAAATLRASRSAAAGRLGPAVEAQLRALALRRPLRSRLTPAADGPRGADRGEFLLAANPGEATNRSPGAPPGENYRGRCWRSTSCSRAPAAPDDGLDEVDAGSGARSPPRWERASRSSPAATRSSA